MSDLNLEGDYDQDVRANYKSLYRYVASLEALLCLLSGVAFYFVSQVPQLAQLQPLPGTVFLASVGVTVVEIGSVLLTRYLLNIDQVMLSIWLAIPISWVVGLLVAFYQLLETGSGSFLLVHFLMTSMAAGCLLVIAAALEALRRQFERTL